MCSPIGEQQHYHTQVILRSKPYGETQQAGPTMYLHKPTYNLWYEAILSAWQSYISMQYQKIPHLS
jgi:hypothetical protein